MYGNTTTRTCQNCPATCLSCINSTYCTDCLPNSEYSSADGSCYSHCNGTIQYSIGKTCVSVCPDGTYSDYTNVTCQACNSICATCFGGSLNCTSCSNAFFYNNTCLSQCPAGLFAINSTCVPCSSTSAGCAKPLTFTTTTTVENYQQVIIIKFNQNTKVLGDPTQFINVNLQMTRRLLDVSNIVNNGISFKAVVMPDGTIKLYLDPGVSLNNVKYSISFTNVNMIQAENGATLQNLE